MTSLSLPVFDTPFVIVESNSLEDSPLVSEIHVVTATPCVAPEDDLQTNIERLKKQIAEIDQLIQNNKQSTEPPPVHLSDSDVIEIQKTLEEKTTPRPIYVQPGDVIERLHVAERKRRGRPRRSDLSHNKRQKTAVDQKTSSLLFNSPSSMELKEQPDFIQRKLYATEHRHITPGTMIVNWKHSVGPITVRVTLCDVNGVELQNQFWLGGPKEVVCWSRQTSAYFHHLQFFQCSKKQKWRLCFK